MFYGLLIEFQILYGAGSSYGTNEFQEFVLKFLCFDACVVPVTTCFSDGLFVYDSDVSHTEQNGMSRTNTSQAALNPCQTYSKSVMVSFYLFFSLVLDVCEFGMLHVANKSV